MTVKFTNNASTTLASGINTTATSITVADASSFPSLSGADDYAYLTLQEATGTGREIVKATALSSNTFTIVRAQDNTTARTHSSGDIVELRLTSALLTDVINAATVEGIKTNFQYTPTAGQTVFTGADNSSNTLIINDSSLINVYLNGARLVQGTDYTVDVNNNRVTLASGGTTADILDIEVFGNFTGQSGAAVAITGGAITGATIDNAVIGGSTAAAGTFTTIAGALASSVTGTTQSAGSNNTLIATTAYVETAVSNLIDSAPNNLNTLNELAAAMNDNASFFSTVLPLSGGTMTGDLILGDNVKLEVGSASGGDLQIYHDTNHSYIEEAGTGALKIKGDDVRIENASGNNIIKAVSNSAELYENGSKKLETTSTGVIVTGEATITGQNTSHGASRLKVSQESTAISQIRFYGADTSTAGILQFTGSSSDGAVGGERMRIDSSGNVGIGASSPTFGSGSGLEVSRSGTATVRVERTGSTASSGEFFAGNGKVVLSSISNNHLEFRTNNTEKMRIDSSGQLLHGIYTLPTGVLLGRQLVSSSATGAEIIAFREDAAIETDDKTGAFLVGNSDTSGTEDHFAGMYGKASDVYGRQDLHFVAGRDAYEGDTPQMTLDNSGNFLVGKTVTTQNTAGTAISATLGVRATVDQNVASILNRTTDDGDVVLFRKDGSTVGSIGTTSGGIYLGSPSGAGKYFANNGNFSPSADGSKNLGDSSLRWQDLYLSGDLITGGGGTSATGEISFVADSQRARIVGGYDSGGGGYIAFRTDTTGGTDLERARFNNAGNLAFTNGNGIDFSATSDATGASSELLDDYEEGTHTCTVTMGSGTCSLYSNYNKIKYTKIGRLVTIQGQIRVYSVSNPSGEMQVSMPFSIDTTDDEGANVSGSVVRTYNGNAPTGGLFLHGVMVFNRSDKVVLAWVRSGASTLDHTPVNDEYLLFNFSYCTA